MFVIIDGSGLMCTQYYGTLPETLKYRVGVYNSDEEYEEALKEELPKCYMDGKVVYTNGLQGYLQSLLSILYRFKPEQIVVCFDASRSSTFRRQLSADYKAQRTKSPEPLSIQMKEAKKLTRELGINVLEDPLYEADDFAGTLAKFYASHGKEVRLLTKDRDYFQLIDDHIHGWIMQPEKKIEELSGKYGECTTAPLGCYEYTSEIVEDEIGVGPDKIVDWKALAGDPSDNIPGVKGVGDKAAIPLLKEYGSIEKIYEQMPDSIDESAIESLKKSWKENLGIARPPVLKLIEGKEDAMLSKELATIKTDVPEELWVYHDYTTPSFANGLGQYGMFDHIGQVYEMESLIEQARDFNAGVDYMDWVEQKRAEREEEHENEL